MAIGQCNAVAGGPCHGPALIAIAGGRVIAMNYAMLKPLIDNYKSTIGSLPNNILIELISLTMVPALFKA